MNQLTKLQVIDKTVEHIQKNGRSINQQNECVLLNEKGKQCAISIWLNDDFDKIGFDIDTTPITDAINSGRIRLDDFKESVRHINSPFFWQNLQDIHDQSVNWHKGKLSTVGVETVKSLKKKYQHP